MNHDDDAHSNSSESARRAMAVVAARWGLSSSVDSLPQEMVPVGALPQDALDGFIESLAQKVSELMHQDHAKFMQALYRLDVDENQVQRIMFGSQDRSAKTSKSRALAELIFKREWQKAKSRGDI